MQLRLAQGHRFVAMTLRSHANGRLTKNSFAHRLALTLHAIPFKMKLIYQSITNGANMLQDLLQSMTTRVRERGWTDRHWAFTAKIRPETLSRVRHRGSCDVATLDALAQACGLELVTRDPAVAVATDASGLFPRQFDRALEERLLALCVSGDVDPAHWRILGPSFFVAGLAAMLSCFDDLDPDDRYSKLAEVLHPGVLAVSALRFWLQRSPVKASRFLPMLRKLRGNALSPSWQAPSPLRQERHASQ